MKWLDEDEICANFDGLSAAKARRKRAAKKGGEDDDDDDDESKRIKRTHFRRPNSTTRWIFPTQFLKIDRSVKTSPSFGRR